MRAAEALLIQQEAQEATARQLASAAVGKGIPKDRVVSMLQEIQAATGCGMGRARELLCEANLDANSAVRASRSSSPFERHGLGSDREEVLSAGGAFLQPGARPRSGSGSGSGPGLGAVPSGRRLLRTALQ